MTRRSACSCAGLGNRLTRRKHCRLASKRLRGFRKASTNPWLIQSATKCSPVVEARIAQPDALIPDGFDDAHAETSTVADLLQVPVADNLPIPNFARRCNRAVRFDLASTSMHHVTPYAEIYGAHPRTFVFDRYLQMIPAGQVVPEDEDEDEIASPWLQSCADDDDDAPSSEDEAWQDMFMLTHSTMESRQDLPDLDDESGWDAWLASN